MKELCTDCDTRSRLLKLMTNLVLFCVLIQNGPHGRFDMIAFDAYTLSIGLIQVKEEGWTGFSKGRQGCSKGFSEGKARGNAWTVSYCLS